MHKIIKALVTMRELIFAAAIIAVIFIINSPLFASTVGI